MTNPLIRKLAAYTKLSETEKALLDELCSNDIRELDARKDLISEGDTPNNIYLMLSGWACRYKETPAGERQIVAFFLPGDLCDLHMFALRQMDHSVGALTQCRYAAMPRQRFEDECAAYPRLMKALWWETLVHSAILREWLLNIGQRDARTRISHLLSEIYLRLDAVGLSKDGHCDFPATQTDLADAAGLTSVHVNRVIQDLRASGLIILENKKLHIPRLDALRKAGLFDPDYLHLGGEGRAMDAADPADRLRQPTED